MSYKKSNNQFPFLFVIIALLAVSSGAVLKNQSNGQKPGVLGIMQLLAKGGDDSGSSGGGDDHGGSSGGSGSSVDVSGSAQPTSTPKIEKTETEQETEIKPTAGVKAPEQTEAETETETEQELEHVNKELETEDVHVGTSAGGFTVKHGEVEAETHFPLSVDAATHTLTVTTPAGVKTVTVLPDQAVNNMLSHNILDRIEASGAAEKIELTETENQPAFAIKGFDDKRFLGFIPVSVAKTAFISAQTGNVIKTEESFLNSILDRLSL